MGSAMLDTQLINVDGMWGAGKSTTLLVLARHLEDQGVPCEMYHDEHDHHPVFEGFLNCGHESGDSRLFADETVRAWEAMAERLAGSGTIVLTQTAFFNHPIRRLMVAGWNRNRIRDYCRNVFQATAPLKPVLINLRHDDVAKAWRAQRDTRSATWQEFMRSQFPSWSPDRPSSEDAFISLLSDATELSDSLLDEFSGTKLAIEVSGDAWDEYYGCVTDILEVPPVGFGDFLPDAYVGRYQETRTRRECVVTTAGNLLVIRGYFGPKRPMLFDMYALGRPPLEQDRGAFEIPDIISVDIAFERGPGGEVEQMVVENETILQDKGASGDSCKGSVWLKLPD